MFTSVVTGITDTTRSRADDLFVKSFRLAEEQFHHAGCNTP